MGYNLTIGEMHVEVDHKDRSAFVSVACMDGTDLGAPEDSTGFGSHDSMILPSYSSWGKFCRNVGLYHVFYGDNCVRENGEYVEPYINPLLLNHPGNEPLTEWHVRRFGHALEQYGPARTSGASYIDGVDWDHRRLVWLDWWTRWAVENCEYPTFANG